MDKKIISTWTLNQAHMDITSPRIASFISILVALLYVIGLSRFQDFFLTTQVILIFIFVISLFIFIAAFNFAGNELKDTEGVLSVLELPILKIFATFIFGIFIMAGYDAFILILIEFSKEKELGFELIITAVLLVVILGYLLIFPFFQNIILAKPGEDSSIPSEFILENILEFLRNIVRSPFIAAVIVYGIMYIIPILIIGYAFNNLFTSLILWALFTPLVAVSALAGVGIGEDLIRLRLVRKPFSDLKRLGLPKISLRHLKFDSGGLFLVLFAIQAIITTAIFGFLGLARAFNILGRGVGEFSIFTLLITLLNKGRGAMKELKEVWLEAGFKVSVTRLFLPVFVFLGVIMSSSLEVFASQASSTNNVFVHSYPIIGDPGLDKNLGLIYFFLVIQNFLMIFSALYILKTTPGTAERRLIKEVPTFYVNPDGSPDVDGYLHLYKKLKSERSVENLIREFAKLVKKNPKQAYFIKDILRESLTNGTEAIQLVSSETLFNIAQKLEEKDSDFTELTSIATNSPYPGVRIYAVKTMKILVELEEGIAKENAIKDLQKLVADSDPVVAWDAGLGLQRIIENDEEYRSFILAMMIRTLNHTTLESTIDSITRFLNKVSSENLIVGQMAVSTLGTQISSEGVENAENLIDGIKSILRGRPSLAFDLIDLVTVGIQHPDSEFRKNSFKILINLAQYADRGEEEIVNLILSGINDQSDDIKILAYEAMRMEVTKGTSMVDEIFTYLQSTYNILQNKPLLSALDVVDAIIKLDKNYDSPVFELIKDSTKSDSAEVRTKTLNILGDIALKEKSLAEKVYYLASENKDNQSEVVRESAIGALGKAVISDPNLVSAVYRILNTAREDNSFVVQVAAIEALGGVAAAGKKYADEIYPSFIPLLSDDNWQVRLAALNGLFAAAQQQKNLLDELAKQAVYTLIDDDITIRNQTLDIIAWTVANSRESAEIMVNSIKKFNKNLDDELKTSIYSALEIIVDRRPTVMYDVIGKLNDGFDLYSNSARLAASEALSTLLKKLSKAREANKDVIKALNKLLDNILNAANNSRPGIRRNAYEAIMNICIALPDYKIAERGRKALKKAKDAEKDVALTDFLDTAIVRSRKPLDWDTKK